MNIILSIPLIISILTVILFLPIWIKKAKKIGLVWDNMNEFAKGKIAGSGGIVVVMGFVFGVLLYIALKTFVLGEGHMNFFKDKLKYLSKRHSVVKQECISRGFNCHNLSIIIKENHPLCNDWIPNLTDSKLVRERIIEKLIKRFEKSPTFWKYKSNVLTKKLLYELIDCIDDGYLFYV